MTETAAKPIPPKTSQEVVNERFSKEAAEWDANKKHVESTQKAFEAIMKHVPAFAEGRGKGTSFGVPGL